MVVIGNWHELRRPSTTTSLFTQVSVMNRALPEMLHCLEESLTMNGAEMSVLERQRDRFKWQQQQSINESSNLLIPPSMTQQFHGELINKNTLINCSMNVGLSLDNGSSGFGEFSIPRPDFGDGIMGFGSNGSVRMEGREIDLMTKMASTTVGRESFKKRKADKPHDSKVVVVAAATENSNDKRIKVDVEKVDSKVISTDQENNREVSIDTSRENSKVLEVKKQDYIHVRARRGQATDSHSLAERVRREKISERMKYLQDLVPGCNKITGKAGMLDEIINYVQSLQRQVEFLSMKLATVNPRLDDNYFKKEMFKTCTESYPTMGVLSEVENPAFLQFNQVQQLVSCTGLEMVINPSEISHERSVIAPVSVSQEAFMDSSCFFQTQPSSTWESDFQSIYNTVEFNQGRPTTTTAFPSQQFHGLMEAANNLKMKM